MSPNQRYERIVEHEEDDLPINSNELSGQNAIPNSPPPSFRSRTTSRRSSVQHTEQEQEMERSLADAFDGPSDDESDDEESDRRRLVQDEAEPNNPPRPSQVQRRVTEIPTFTSTSTASSQRVVYGGGSGSSSATRDGVFANITAKHTPEEESEEKPPTYEQAAADATPPYWETTILTPGGFNSDDIFVDGLLVGSMFSFVWNALISMSFQLIGFLLTYLLHTTHAAKHGSRAGLGITLIQYGFTMRTSPAATGPPGDKIGSMPADPNAHDFDPHAVVDEAGQPNGGMAGSITTGDWLSYLLMVVGWFILIKAASDFVRARRQEALVRASPDRGLPVPVVAVGEGENAV